MVVRADTDEPVYTPSNVSKLLPLVVMVVLPEAGAVQDHQTDLPPPLPAWLGSPVSLLAPAFEPVTVIDEPLVTVALAKLSFAGPADCAACETVRVLPAMVRVPLRELVAVLEATE